MHYAKRARTKTKLLLPVTAEDQQRRMLWQMLVDLKVISADTPMPPPRKPEDDIVTRNRIVYLAIVLALMSSGAHAQQQTMMMHGQSDRTCRHRQRWCDDDL